jgi:type I restriction enzyme S subunit
MGEVAPIVRRRIDIDPLNEYYELGIKSRGLGSFHKPPINGEKIRKKLYLIKEGDVVFNNVFAWEGAVAVAKPEDDGRVGSHRFISCVPKKEVILPDFLFYYYTTFEGLRKLGKASPGGAGRNRTLGLKKLEKILVPVPDKEEQLFFVSIYKKVCIMKDLNYESIDILNKVSPSIINQEFKVH